MFLKIFLGIIIIGLLAGGGYYFWQSRVAATTTETTETSPTPDIEQPTPTPEKNVEKDAFSIEIQNGSGIAGEAGRAQELLEGDDFKVNGTANADNYDYEETVIQAGDDVPDAWIDELIATLEKNYTVQTRIDDKGTSDADVVVIVGKFDDSGESMVTEEEATTDEEVTPTPEEESEDPTNTPSPSPTP
jgi:hypothetical protein